MSFILITGNTGLLTQEFLDILAEEYKVVVTVDQSLGEAAGREGNLDIYQTVPTEEKFRQLFDAYHFESVCYLSGYADSGKGLAGEHEWLETIFDCCRAHRISKFVLISTVESQNFTLQLGRSGELLGRQYESQKAFSAGQVEEWCSYLARRTETRLITLWCPYLAGEANEELFLGQIFSQMVRHRENQTIVLPYGAEGRVDFLSLKDLAYLLLQIFQETEDETAGYFAVSGYGRTWEEVSAAITASEPEVKVEFSRDLNRTQLPDYPDKLRKNYGFIPMDDVLTDFAKGYAAYQELLRRRRKKWWQRTHEKLLAVFKGALKYIELFLVFLLTEFLAGFTANSVYFKMVDVRLLYIIMMAMLYGLHLGVMAAVLECIVLVRRWAEIGLGAVVLFYNFENWIPFVFYLMAGSIVGYLVDKRTNEMSFARKEMTLLRDKYSFLKRIYQGVLENRSEYRRQILGFQDSFGKIFEAVQRLDGEIAGSVLMKGLQVLEDVLHNHSVAIYTLDSWQRFGRLAVCSNSMLSRLTKSLRVADVQEIYDTIQSGEVYRNTEFKKEYPAYAYGVMRADKLVFLVLIWEVSPEQYGIYYMNLFRILCGLMQTSFLRAMDYEILQHEKTYYEGTQIARTEYFAKNLQIQEDMREAGISDFVLVKFRCRDRMELTEKLAGMIRANDLLGTDAEGNIYLVLTQMRFQNFDVVKRRFEERNVEYDVVEKVG